MNNYKPAQVISIETTNHLEEEYNNRMGLIEAIQSRYHDRSRSVLLGYDTDQLEALLEFGSPHAYASKEYTDDRNFLSTTSGRVHKGVEVEAGRDYRDWHDMRVMKRIKGFRAYKRIQFVSKDKTPEELKEDKINEILETVDDRYRVVIKHIREEDMTQLVDLCLNKYEVNIRKIIAALLRVRSPEYGQFPTIEQSCAALGVEKKDFLAAATELSQCGIYTREKIASNFEVIIEQARTLVYRLQELHHEVTYDIGQAIMAELTLSYGYLKENLELLRLDKVIPLVLMVAQRHVELSPVELLSPLMNHPDYSQKLLRNGLKSFHSLDKKVPEFVTVDFTETIYPVVSFQELFDHEYLTPVNNRLKSLNQMMSYEYISSYSVEIDLLHEETAMTSTIKLYCGLKGELYRSHLRLLQDSGLDNLIVISHQTKQAWENTTTYLGPSKYALPISKLGNDIEFIIVDSSFTSLMTAIEAQAEATGNLLVISDIRPFIHSNEIESNLDYYIHEALKVYATRLIADYTRQGKLLLKTELYQALIKYRQRYRDDTRKGINIEANEEAYLYHHPRLTPHTSHYISKLINMKNTAIGCSFSSNLVVGKGGQEEIYVREFRRKSTNKFPSDKLLDYVLWSLENKVYVNPGINDPKALRYHPITITDLPHQGVIV